MVIEVLFKELYIYGEKGNIDYLEKMFEDEEFIFTSLLDEPYFSKKKPDLIIIEPISHHYYDVIIEKLIKYKERLKELIEEGVYFIAFGDSIDFFSKELNVSGEIKKTLNLFEYTVKKDLAKRISKLVCAEYKGDLILGSQLSFSKYEGNKDNYIYKIKAGIGFDESIGGYRYKNAFMVEMIGNIFMYNPSISKRLLRVFGKEEKLPLEKYVYKSYNERIKSWKDDNII